MTVVDPEPRCPAALKGAEVIAKPMHDEQALTELASKSDVITVDLEAVNVEALAAIAAAGTPVIPDPTVLKQMTNKLTQKQVMLDQGIATSPFHPFDGSDLTRLGHLGWPVVNKAASGGYDGRGVAIIESEADAGKVLPVPGFIEAYVEHQMEIAVMVARDADRTTTWAPVEMVFNQAGNLLDQLVAPARISTDLGRQAEALARRAIEAFNGIGIFGVEMFLTNEEELLVNEISPRTHNSGHYTMDVCAPSQFEQQYRLLIGEPLLEPTMTGSAVMFNLLGATGYQGETVIEGLDDLVCLDSVHPYIYGKHQCFPLRKMGHVTVTGDSVDQALGLAETARSLINIRGAEAIERP